MPRVRGASGWTLSALILTVHLGTGALPRTASAQDDLVRITGHVSDLNGRPCPFVDVDILILDAFGWMHLGYDVTQPDGSYEFLGLLAGRTYRLEPSMAGTTFDPVRTEIVDLRDDTEANFTVRLGVFKRYFAEGATGAFFDTSIALLNDTHLTSHVLASFQRSDGATMSVPLAVPPYSRSTLDPRLVPGLASAEFSTVIESDVPLIADRVMRWDGTAYGAHAEAAMVSPALTWHLAEGATFGGFNLFYLLQNPADADALVSVTFLRPAPAPPIVRHYVVAAQRRLTLWVNTIDPALASTEVSAIITSDNAQPILVERAMYLDTDDRVFRAGHASAGVTAPSTRWHFAEGATGPFFDTFLLIANATGNAAATRLEYLLPSGTTVVRTHVVSPRSRKTIWVDVEGPELADTAFATTVRSLDDVPIVVERAMWWPGPAGAWREGHDSAGAAATGRKWMMAAGEVGTAATADAADTYILVANTSPFEDDVAVRLVFDDATRAERVFRIGARSRMNVNVRDAFPESVGRRFGAVVESRGLIDPAIGRARFADLVVERAMYGASAGVSWASGSCAMLTRIR